VQAAQEKMYSRTAGMPSVRSVGLILPSGQPTLTVGTRGCRPCSYQSTHGTEKKHGPLQPEPDDGRQASKLGPKHDFPVAFFLDPVLFDCCGPWAFAPRPPFIPQSVQCSLADNDSRKALATEYFRTADRWLPITSRIRFYAALLNPSHLTDPGVTSVLLAMKLVLSWPNPGDPCPDIYTLAKEFHLQLEMAGFVSIYTLQSAILMALYELGHAIFPSAFTTIATCARLAVTLGIDGTKPIEGKAWIEQEERNRTWWAIVILDR
jgi:hypothetical protein